MNIKTLSVFLCLGLFMACGEDSEDCTSGSFENQTLQGKIGGVDWSITSGSAEISFFDSSQLSVELSNETSSDPCVGFTGGSTVIFSVPNSTGLYQICLKLDGNGIDQTITLYDGSTNNIVTSGALEILTITDSEVTGRIDGTFDGNNFVNGNFSVPFCE